MGCDDLCHACPVTYADTDKHTDADEHADTDEHADADIYPDTDEHADEYADADIYPDTDEHTDADTTTVHVGDHHGQRRLGLYEQALARSVGSIPERGNGRRNVLPYKKTTRQKVDRAKKEELT